MSREGKQPKSAATEELLNRLAQGLVPDEELRRLVRVQIARRLKWGYKSTYEEQLAQVLDLTKSLRKMNIANASEALNSEWYEVPMSFLKLIFGKTLKERNLQLSNVEIILADVSKLEMEATFDRIVVIGLLEHIYNYELFLRKVSQWMNHDSLLLVDHSCHKTMAYGNEPIDDDDWYTDYMFPGGTYIIPSSSFLLYFQDDLSVVDHWIVNGKHVGRTMKECLKNMDSNMNAIKKIMESSTGNVEEAMKIIIHWRFFFIAEGEVYAHNDGEEWMCSHVVFKKK